MPLKLLQLAIEVRAYRGEDEERFHSPRRVEVTNDAASRAAFFATLRCCARSMNGSAR